MASQSEPQTIPSLLIDNPDSLGLFLQDLIEVVHSQCPTLYVDLEGIQLSRNGSVSLLTVLLHSNGKPDRVYLVDIHTLGSSAFTTVASSSSDREIQTLKDILETRKIPKVFFDVRNDSDALFSHFDIRMKGIIDLQLMENASLNTRANGKRFLASLGKCIKYDSGLSDAEKKVWETSKDKGKRLFAPKEGGRYETFNERPLHDDLKIYCVQDVRLLPRLHDIYDTKLRIMSGSWARKIKNETKRRLEESMAASYEPNGKDKALAPVWKEVSDDRSSEDEEWDGYEDTARDCEGWEDDMIKNGEYF
jgi:exonuclease 3'-5' domain-containing protein 1